MKKLNYYDQEHRGSTDNLEEMQAEYDDVFNIINQEDNSKLCLKTVEAKAKHLIELKTQSYLKEIGKIKTISVVDEYPFIYAAKIQLSHKSIRKKHLETSHGKSSLILWKKKFCKLIK